MEMIGHDRLTFSLAEYRRRYDQVKWGMRELGIDAFLVRTPEDIYYLTGYENPATFAFHCLLLSGDEPVLILRRLLPHAEVVVIDRSAANLKTARQFLGEELPCIHACYDPALVADFDLTIIPLAFIGDREAIYRHVPTPAVLVHDWLWRRRGVSAVVSVWLLNA